MASSTTPRASDDDSSEAPPPPPSAPPPRRSGSSSWSEDDGDDSSPSPSRKQQRQQQHGVKRIPPRHYDSPAYVSSASSNEPPTPDRIKTTFSMPAGEKGAATTIGTPPLMVRQSNSMEDDSFLASHHIQPQQQPQPNHQFVQSFYDSDGSDGSLVFSYPRGTTPPATYDFMRSHHERWGSMDSFSSVNKDLASPKVLQHQHQQRTLPTPQKQPQRHIASPQNVYNNYNPQVLPYHQRRKLLQKRQEQQQQGQAGGAANQMLMQQPYHFDGHHLDPNVAPPMYAGSVQFYGHHLQAPAHPRRSLAFKTSPKNLVSKQAPSRSPTGSKAMVNVTSSGNSPPTFHSRRPGPLDTISASAGATTTTTPSQHALKQQQHPQQVHHPPPAAPPISYSYSLPPIGHSRSFSGSGSFVLTSRNRLGSVDSNTSSDSATGKSNRPPLQVVPPYSHIRTESSGSVSSLGSGSDQAPPINKQQGASLTDRLDQDIMGYLREQEQRHVLPPPPPPPPPAAAAPLQPPPQGHAQQRSQQAISQKQEHRRSNGGSGFLLGLFNLSPKQQNRHTPNVEEYHQRNQAFLQRAERERAKMRPNQPAPLYNARRKTNSSSSPRPPNTRGVHRPGLSSIDNDNWEEEASAKHIAAGKSHKNAPYQTNARNKKHNPEQQQQHGDARNSNRQEGSARRSAAILQQDQYRRRRVSGDVERSSSFVSSSQEDEESDDEGSSSGRDRFGSNSNQEAESDEANERTSLLPPSGISTHEGERSSSSNRNSHNYTVDRSRRRNDFAFQNEETVRWDNRHAALVAKKSKGHRGKNRRKHKKKDKSRRRHKHISPDTDESNGDDLSYLSSSSSEHDHKRWAKKRAKMFAKERTKLIAQWKAEAKAEAEAAQKLAEANRWHRRVGRWMEEEFTHLVDSVLKFLATAETFICNLPLTIGAVALAIVTLGVVWFKFAEENLDSCEPVHFHSSQCTFPEFPGCFYCDTHTRLYKLAVNFHFCCSAIAGVLAMGFVAKVILATRVVLDEMSSPTTSSPAGLICMTTVCVFAGRGWIGQVLVSAAATLHLGLVIWFIYMALAYHIMPEPSWYPNTVGVGLSAVKTWLYYPVPGHFLMAISLSLNFFFFPISLIRVTLNKKISAPVCWIQMSAPAISLYALTIMAQPSFAEEHPDVTRFQRVHRMVYLPCMHFLFVLAILGVLSSVQSLATRWEKFRGKEFSPAHAAFCFPTLAHVNAIQAYKAAVDAFSDDEPGSPFKIALYTYWVIALAVGTVTTLAVTAKFFYYLPSWTQVDVADEEEPPAPNETTLRDVIATGETLRQPFVSPAVLQANETGALVFLRRGGEDGRGRYVRTRRLPALGFEPTMNWSEMNAERDVLLDWVAKNPPRRRKKTLSVPGIDFNYGFGDFGTGNSGVYGLEGGEGGHGRAFSVGPPRERSNTFDPSYGFY